MPKIAGMKSPRTAPRSLIASVTTPETVEVDNSITGYLLLYNFSILLDVARNSGFDPYSMSCGTNSTSDNQ